MKRILILFAFVLVYDALSAQRTYSIMADSVKITNCDSAELIIENHTQNVPGFLYNTGNGRTIFKRGAQSLGNGIYVIGTDTIKTTANTWLQGGNTFGTTGVLGTIDNNHLDLYTDNTQRLRLTNLGRLLLGTTTDDNKDALQVNGSVYGTLFTNITTPSTSPSGAIRLHWGSGDGGYISFYYQGRDFKRGGISSPSDTRPVIFADSIGLFLNAPTVALGSEGGLSNAKLAVANLMGSTADAISTSRMTGPTTFLTDFEIKPTGNVIIGGGSDAGKRLQVNGSVRFDSLTVDNSQTRVLVSNASGDLFYRDASTLASLDPVRSSLAVNGTITAQRLKLAAIDWPDYVFGDGYQLLSPDSLRQYIDRNSHLPGVPAAAEVEKKGLDVGDNQAALLKKIEELTLYMLKQQEEIKMLKADMEKLQNTNSK